jgi:hypothetical protein
MLGLTDEVTTVANAAISRATWNGGEGRDGDAPIHDEWRKKAK